MPDPNEDILAQLAALRTQVATLAARDERREAQVIQLAQENAALKPRLARCESEHVSLLTVHAELLKDRDRERNEATETMKLFSSYWDERLGGWQQRLASAGGGEDPALVQAISEFMKDLGQLIGSALIQQEVRIMEKMASHQERALNLIGKVADASAAR